jgi:microcystin-dependent protein
MSEQVILDREAPPWAQRLQTDLNALMTRLDRKAVNAGSAAAEAAEAAAAAALLAPPVGMLADFAGSSAPSLWLLCYGQAVSRTTYAALFTVVGIAFGSGDGSTTFNVPDMRGRVAIGKDNMGGSGANRVTTAGSSLDGNTIGASGGSQFLHAHTHDYTDSTASGSNQFQSGGTTLLQNVTNPTKTTSSAGAGNSQNMPPGVIVNKIIYAGV